MLDTLDLLGQMTWEPLWMPVLAWTVLAFPLWMLLRQTDRLHPHAEYRLSQVVLATLPVSLLVSALPPLLPASTALSPVSSLSVVAVSVKKTSESASQAASAWHWSHTVGMATVAAIGMGLVRLCRLGFDAVAA